MKTLSIEERSNYLKIGLALQGIGIDPKTSELIITTYEKILKKGGNFNIHDAVELQLANERKYKEIEIKAKSKDKKE